ncbi:MAG: glutaredoxin domain-containing protein [Aureliella sp.]
MSNRCDAHPYLSVLADVRRHRFSRWHSLAAIAFGMVAALIAPSAQAQAPASVRCIVLELYVRSSDAQAKASIDAIREYVAEKRGLQLKTYDVDQDAQGLARLKAIASAYRLSDPPLPLVYGMNTTVSAAGTRELWRARLSELLRMEVFTRQGCPRCAKAKEYLPTFVKKYPAIQVQVYEVLSDPQANQRFAELVAQHRIAGASYPGFNFCQHLVIGFDNEKAMAERLDRILSRWTFECKLNALGSSTTERNRTTRFAALERPAHWPLDLTLTGRTLAVAQVERPEANSKVQGDKESPADTGPPPLPIAGPEGEGESVQPTDQALPLPLPEGGEQADQSAAQTDSQEADSVEIAWLGRLSAKQLGMPLFTLAIGLIDGFNPCAMWVLLFLLSVLVNLQDRGKILAVAGTFVLVSGLAYYAFMAAWLNVLLLVGFLRWVQIALAFLAIFVGSVHIKDYFAFKKVIRLSIPESAKPRIYEQVRRVVTAENITGAIVGAIVLAVLVNIIELLCTAGLPALYTQVLSQQGYPSWEHYAYLGLYIAAYMFDDMVMLAVVVITLSRRKLQETEGRWLKLVSGLVILALGLVLLFKPEWIE